MVSRNSRTDDSGEISLNELTAALWKGRRLIILTTVTLTILSAIAAFLTPPKFAAATVISPVAESPGSQLGGLSSLTSQFGGLASLAGLSIGGDSKKAESLAVLQSEVLTENYIRINNLLPTLFSDKWDSTNARWRDTDPKLVPTLWQANRYFKKGVRSILTDQKTGLITLTITWKDPAIAARWANDLVKMTNEYLRDKAVDQADRDIAYLNDQAAKTDAVGARQAIYAILQTEINKAMIARGSSEYAFKVIDPAIAPERPSSPQKSIWILAGMFAGLFISSFVVYVRLTGKST
jgi:uncharacterized protein involved in exopolysaccharide biosynthesis